MMKKFITLALIISATTFTQAQNNLVFNRVLNFRLADEVPVTVPEGKAWKIEASSNLTNFSIYSNDITPPYGLAMDSSNSGVLNLINSETVWVAEGCSIVHRNGSNNFVSILEFNVVPTSSSSGGSGGGGVSSDGLVFSGMINQFIPTSSVTGIGTVAGSFTVPEGKVWKISTMTHKTISSQLSVVYPNGNLSIGMNGVPIYNIGSEVDTVTTSTSSNFLTPGTYELKWYEGSGAGGPFFCGNTTHLVAIEYNLP